MFEPAFLVSVLFRRPASRRATCAKRGLSFQVSRICILSILGSVFFEPRSARSSKISRRFRLVPTFVVGILSNSRRRLLGHLHRVTAV
jgi:hypothetical protein